jgi:hypothetical protein
MTLRPELPNPADERNDPPGDRASISLARSAELLNRLEEPTDDGRSSATSAYATSDPAAVLEEIHDELSRVLATTSQPARPGQR